MAPDKLLAEWFWVDRWMGSSAFALPIDARGLYREMLSQAWRRGARLPNDPDQVRRMAGVTQKEWARCWPLVEKYWRVDGDELVNDTQLTIYANAQALSAKRSAAGKVGSDTRWHSKPIASASANTIANPIANPIANTSPPSPNSELRTPISEKKEHDRALVRHGHSIIGRNPHLDHAACDSQLSCCVPAAVHRKLADLLAPKHGGDRDAAKAELQAWYQTVWLVLPNAFVMGDAFKFWQGRFDATFATPDPKVSSSNRRLIETTPEEDGAAVLAMLQKERGA